MAIPQAPPAEAAGGVAEWVSLGGPARLAPCQTGTYVPQLHAFSGALTYTWWRREITTSGKTAWVRIGTGPTMDAQMTCAGGALALAAAAPAPTAALPETGFELKVEAAAAGSSYRSVATLPVLRSAPPPCQKNCEER